MKNLSIVLGLSLLLAACSGATDESQPESEENTNGQEESTEEMEGDTAQSEDNQEDMKKSEESGTAEEEEKKSLAVEINKKKMEDGHHGEGLSIMLKPVDDSPAEMTATIEKQDGALEEASVRFEYWKEGEERHIYTDAEENANGKYSAKTEITDPGTYNMKVHVEKGENLHTHKPFVLEVKEEMS